MQFSIALFLTSVLLATHSIDGNTTPLWSPTQSYEVGDIVFHIDTEYECIQAHSEPIEPLENPIWMAFWKDLG